MRNRAHTTTAGLQQTSLESGCNRSQTESPLPSTRDMLKGIRKIFARDRRRKERGKLDASALNNLRIERTRYYLRASAELGCRYGDRVADLTEDEREMIIRRFEVALGGRHNALSMLEDLKMGTSRTLRSL